MKILRKTSVRWLLSSSCQISWVFRHVNMASAVFQIPAFRILFRIATSQQSPADRGRLPRRPEPPLHGLIQPWEKDRSEKACILEPRGTHPRSQSPSGSLRGEITFQFPPKSLSPHSTPSTNSYMSASSFFKAEVLSLSERAWEDRLLCFIPCISGYTGYYGQLERSPSAKKKVELHPIFDDNTHTLS